MVVEAGVHRRGLGWFVAGWSGARRPVRDRCENKRVIVLLPRFRRAAVAAVFALAVVGCHRTPPPTPLSELTPQQMAGHDVFQAKCAVCHYDREDKPRNGPALLGLYKKPALPSGAPANDDRVTDTILHGHGLMPAMGSQVDEEQLAELLAYLHTL